jgi:predicted transcriptional regulator
MAMPDSIELAAEVVAAYVSNNPLPKSDLPDLILAVHSSLTRLGREPDHAPLQAEVKSSGVPIRKSVTPRLFDLSGGRQKIQFSAPSSGAAWTDARAVSREMEATF